MTARRRGIAVPRNNPPDRDPDDWMRSAAFVLRWLIFIIVLYFILLIVAQYFGL